MEDKKNLRRQLLRHRQALSRETWQRKSQQICDLISGLTIFQTSKVVLAFSNFRQEPDLSSLWQKFPNKSWGLSRCVEERLVWHEIDPLHLEASTELGKFGIREPLAHLPLIDRQSVDLILIPAISYNYKGYRLGYGGGFYDRFLVEQVGFRMGVVFSDYLVKDLPTEPWDIPAQAICMETGILNYG